MTALLLLIYNIITPLIIFIILTIGIFVSLLSLRIKIPIISWFLDNFERNKDKNRLPGRGIIFAVAGSLLALQLFERNIALASIMILTFSDSTSLLIGKYFGKTKSVLNQNKNIEGTIAGILISSIFACFFVPFYLAFVGSLIVGIFELLTIRIQNIKIDDNLIIPLAAGTAMSLILRFLI
jgi:dolichol kinase